MAKILGKVYNVRKNTSTTAVGIGDYQTLEEAEAAMLEHFRTNPKRGNISYRICEEEICEIDGGRYRSQTFAISGGGSSFYKRYIAKELYARLS